MFAVKFMNLSVSFLEALICIFCYEGLELIQKDKRAYSTILLKIQGQVDGENCLRRYNLSQQRLVERGGLTNYHKF